MKRRKRDMAWTRTIKRKRGRKNGVAKCHQGKRGRWVVPTNVLGNVNAGCVFAFDSAVAFVLVLVLALAFVLIIVLVLVLFVFVLVFAFVFVSMLGRVAGVCDRGCGG